MISEVTELPRPTTPPLVEHDAAMNDYLGLMRPAPVVPPELEQAREAALANLHSAQQMLADASQDVAQKTRQAEAYQQDATRAASAVECNAVIQHAESLANALRVAEARAKAAKNMLDKSKQSCDVANAGFKKARQAANDVAQQIHMLHVQGKHREYLDALAQFNNLRLELIAAYCGPGRTALSASDWLKLDSPILGFELLGIRSPEFDIPMNELRDPTFTKLALAEDRLDAARASINHYQQSWSDRLHALASTEAG